MSTRGGSPRHLAGRLAARTPLLLAGALACVLWVVLTLQAERSVFGRVPILDEVWYLDRAAEVAAGTAGDEAHFMSPLYPRLLALAGAGGGVPADRVFSGAELRGARLLHGACWLACLVLLRILARRLLPDDLQGWRRTVAGWLPVVLFLGYRPAAVYGLAVLVELPQLAAVLAAVVLLTRPPGRGDLVAAAGIGVLLGIAGLLRGSALVLVPLAAALVVRGAADRRRGLVHGALVLAAALAAVAPAVVHNSRAAGRPVGPTLNAGVNLYIGNGPSANGFYVAAVPGDWRHDPAGRAHLATRLGRPEPTLAEADVIWRDAALDHVRAHPGRTAGLFLRKVWLHLQGWEIDQLTPLAGWAREVPLLKVLVVPYAVLVILAGAGLGSWWRSGRGRRLLAVLVALVAAQSLFFVVSRYRLVLVPLLCLAAGVGLVRLAQRRRSAIAGAVCALALVVPWGLQPVQAQWRGLAAANEALRWADLGRAADRDPALQRAEALYRTALAAVPDRPASWLGLARVQADRGRPADRERVLREGIATVSDPLPLRRALLGALLERDARTEALAVAEAILVEVPDDADALHNAAVLLTRLGRTAAALERAAALRATHPDDPRAYLDQGVIRARSGDREGAREAFAAGLARFPGHPDLQANLARLGD